MNIRFSLLGIFHPVSDNEGVKAKRTANKLLSEKDWKLATTEYNNSFRSNSIPEYLFTWQFTHQEKTLDYLFRADNILKLDEEELILYKDEANDNGQVSRHVTIYRH